MLPCARKQRAFLLLLIPVRRRSRPLASCQGRRGKRQSRCGHHWPRIPPQRISVWNEDVGASIEASQEEQNGGPRAGLDEARGRIFAEKQDLRLPQTHENRRGIAVDPRPAALLSWPRIFSEAPSREGRRRSCSRIPPHAQKMTACAPLKTGKSRRPWTDPLSRGSLAARSSRPNLTKGSRRLREHHGGDLAWTRETRYEAVDEALRQREDLNLAKDPRSAETPCIFSRRGLRPTQGILTRGKRLRATNTGPGGLTARADPAALEAILILH
jgi:hypothetical protein